MPAFQSPELPESKALWEQRTDLSSTESLEVECLRPKLA